MVTQAVSSTVPPRALLRRLAEVHAPNKGALSVYVDFDPTIFPTPTDRHTEIDSIVNEAADVFTQTELSHDERNERDATIERLRETLEQHGLAKDKTRTVAVFAAPSQDVFEVLRLPDPMPPAVVAEDSPYLRPLAGDGGPHTWAVLLADRRHGRVLYGGPHRLIDMLRQDDNTPSRVSQGGWAEARIQRHIDEAAREHVDNALELLFRFHEHTNFDALAVAAPDEFYNDVVGRLHPYLRSKLSGRVRIEIEYPSPAQVLEAALPVFDEAAEKRIDEVLTTLEETVPGNKALGPSAVLGALNDRRVDTLVVIDRFTMAGVRCPSCGWLGIDQTDCGFEPGKTTEPREDIVDDAVDAAITQAARVVTVASDARRRPPEAMSALLRF